MSKKTPAEFNPLAALTPEQQKRLAKLRGLLEGHNGKPVDAKWLKWKAEHDEIFRLQFAPAVPESMQKLADDLYSFTTGLLWLLSHGPDQTDLVGLSGMVQKFYDRAHRLDQSHPDRPLSPMTLDGAKLASEKLLRWTRVRITGENSPAPAADTAVVDGPWATSKLIRANSSVLPRQIRTRRNREKDIRAKTSERGRQLVYNCRDVEIAFANKAHGLVKKILALQA